MVYMRSSIKDSMMVRSPRAPVLRLNAWAEMDRRASGVNSRSMPSISKTLRYCLTRALRGSTKIRTSASSERGSRAASTGRRPTNSGIKP